MHNETLIEPDEYLIRSLSDIFLPCEVCGEKNFFSKFCKAHSLLGEDVKSFGCKFCEENYMDRRILQAHVNIEHGKDVHDDPDFQCYMCKICCDQLYLGRDHFQSHLRDTHGETKAVCDSCAISSLDEILLACKLCRAPCLFSGFCREHDANVDIDNCAEHPEQHTCQICQSSHSDCNTLWIHLFSQHFDQVLCCNLCDNSQENIIKAPIMLMNHWRSVHRSSRLDLLSADELREKSEVDIDGATKYQCPDCKKVLKNFYLMKKHVRDTHGGETFSCDVCSKSFSMKRSLREHYRKTHPIRIKANREENDLKKKTMVFVDGVVRHKCPDCGFCVKRFQGLREHIASVHADVKEFVCIVCGAGFGLARRLKVHYVRRHTVNILAAPNTQGVDEQLDVLSIFNVNKEDCQIMQGDKVKFKCPECVRSYGNFSELKKHLAVHTGQKHFVCTVCNKGFFMRNRLNEHYKRVHHLNFAPKDLDLRRETEIRVDGMRKFKCPSCPSSFQRFNAMQEHMLSHTGEKPYLCDICGKEFPLKRRLNAHHKKWHLGKRFRCHICGSTMSNPTNYRDHLDSHKGEKKYTCEQCGTGFAYKSSLYHHRFTHNKDRTYICTYCNRKYQSPKTLKEHLKVHTNGDVRHICETCGSEFHSRKNLLTHVRTHDVGRNHVCELCNANLKTRRSLLKHYTTHGTQLAAIAFNNINPTNQGPPLAPPPPPPHVVPHPTVQPLNNMCLWSCCICNGKFGCSGDLVSHIRSHNNANAMDEAANTLHDVCFKCGNNVVNHKIIQKRGETFECYFCLLNFEDKLTLTYHINIVHGKLVWGDKVEWYTCRKCCNKLYRRRQDITKHMRDVHNSLFDWNECVVRTLEEIQFPCQLCGRECLLSNYCETHLGYKNQNHHCCSYCDETFVDKNMLEAHIHIDHGKEVNGNTGFQCFACRTCCNVLFYDRLNFEIHMRDVHNQVNVNCELFVVNSLRDILGKCEDCRQPCLVSRFCVLHDVDISINRKCDEHVDSHQCPVCQRSYTDCSSLWKHAFLDHSTEKSFCNLCSKLAKNVLMKTPYTLVKHFIRVHGVEDKALKVKSCIVVEGKRMYQCFDCNAIVKKFDTLKEHILKKHSSKLKRSLSRKMYSRRNRKIASKTVDKDDGLKEKSMIIVDDVVKYKCTFCENAYKRITSLREHISSVHFENEQHKCTICDASFVLARRLRAHYIAKHTVHIAFEKKEISIQPQTTGNSEYHLIKSETEIIDGDRIKYKCPLCDKIYTSFSETKRHFEVHSGEKKYECSICSKSFFIKNRLSEHYRRKHQMKVSVARTNQAKQKSEVIVDGVVKYKCDICQSLFKRYDSLRLHLRIHSGEKPYTCDVCGKSFVAKKHLTRHFNCSHGGYGYQCNICGRVMSDSTNFKDHLDNHRGEKKYTCEICGTGFMYKSSLHHHRFSHSAERMFQCSYCDKKYMSPKTLKEHEQMHKNDGIKHICETCGNEFNTRKNMLRHTKVHSMERPYVCEICNVSFKERKSLVRHYKTHKG